MAKKKASKKSAAAGGKKKASKKSAAAGGKKKTISSTAGPRVSRASKASPPKESAARPRKTPVRRTTRYTEAWAGLASNELEQYFRETSPAAILETFDKSYASDVVNVLFDLKKASVRSLFEALGRVRKRGVTAVVTLYYYKDYLMNPLPLEVGVDRTPNYYAILGLPRDAEGEDIKLAHRLLAKAHHTDNFSPSMRASGTERLAEINDAFRHLHPEEKRQETDGALPNMQYLYPRRDQSWLEAAQKILE